MSEDWTSPWRTSLVALLKISIQSSDGDSTRTLAEFMYLLKEVQVDLVVDVRSIPRSRTNLRSTLMSCRRPLPPSNRLPTSARAWRPASSFEVRDAVQRYALAEFVLPKLCRLRRDQRIPRRIKGTRSSRSPQALYHHVCRSHLVALSPPNHRRVPSLRRGSRGPLMGHGKVIPAKLAPGIRSLPDRTLTYPAGEEGSADESHS